MSPQSQGTSFLSPFTIPLLHRIRMRDLACSLFPPTQERIRKGFSSPPLSSSFPLFFSLPMGHDIEAPRRRAALFPPPPLGSRSTRSLSFFFRCGFFLQRCNTSDMGRAPPPPPPPPPPGESKKRPFPSLFFSLLSPSSAPETKAPARSLLRGIGTSFSCPPPADEK